MIVLNSIVNILYIEKLLNKSISGDLIYSLEIIVSLRISNQIVFIIYKFNLKWNYYKWFYSIIKFIASSLGN